MIFQPPFQEATSRFGRGNAWNPGVAAKLYGLANFFDQVSTDELDVGASMPLRSANLSEAIN